MLEAVWATVFLSARTTEASGYTENYSLKQQFGLDDATAAKLVAHIRSSLQAADDADLAAHDAFCGARVVTTDEYVAAKDRATKIVDDVRSAAIDQLTGIVNAEAHAKIMLISSQQRSSMKMIDVDLRKLVENESEGDIARRREVVCADQSRSQR